MGYYCTVPQCTSLAGKTKNVKFHKFPSNTDLATKWNEILHRNKPYTKYSKVCSLHFTQADYNVTTLGQWKTLCKDAIPTQNLPKLNADGTVMIIRKSRSLKMCKQDGSTPKKESQDYTSDKHAEWTNTSPPGYFSSPGSASVNSSVNSSYNTSEMGMRTPNGLQSHQTVSRMSASADDSPHLRSMLGQPQRPAKHDAIMQTDPVGSPLGMEQRNNEDKLAYEEPENYHMHQKEPENYTKDIGDYNKNAENYALERVKRSPYDVRSPSYPPEQIEPYKEDPFQDEDPLKIIPCRDQDPLTNSDPCKDTYKLQYAIPNDGYKNDNFDKNSNESYESQESYPYANREEYFDAADMLRNQQHNLQILQQQLSNERMDGRIKEEIDMTTENGYEFENRTRENDYIMKLFHQKQRLLHFYERHNSIKSEPDLLANCDVPIPEQQSPLPFYYHTEQNEAPMTNGVVGAEYSEEVPERRPGAEMLIAKQNALAATLWPNSLKRPFYYSDTTHLQLNAASLQARYEDVSSVMNQ